MQTSIPDHYPTTADLLAKLYDIRCMLARIEGTLDAMERHWAANAQPAPRGRRARRASPGEPPKAKPTSSWPKSPQKAGARGPRRIPGRGTRHANGGG